MIDATGDADVADRAGAPTHKTPREEMMAASVMFHLAGVDKRAFLEGVRADPQTYRDWGGGGEWNIETSGKEDEMFSPFIMRPFQKAIADGLIPPHLTTIAGTWGAVHDSGELTYMNLVHLDGIDGTDPDDLTRGEIEGRRQAMLAIEALRRYMPGCESARLRNFGMTLGVRDTRKIDARYNMTEDDVRNEARFDDAMGSIPSSSTATGSSCCRRRVAISSCRRATSCRRECATCSWPAVRRAATGSRTPRHETCRVARYSVKALGSWPPSHSTKTAKSTRSTSRPCRRSSTGKACGTGKTHPSCRAQSPVPATERT